MSSWHAPGKIFNVGHAYLDGFFDSEVQIEEKIDGSFFAFGLIDGVLKCRSKGAELNLIAPEKMFTQAVDLAKRLAMEQKLEPGYTYRGEYLQKPKHNALAYDRVPRGHVIIFDVCSAEEHYLPYEEKVMEAERLGLEVVPLLYRGRIDNPDVLRGLIDRTSILGGQKIEGCVLKSYHKFGKDGKAMMAKFVTEAYREVQKGDWREQNPAQGDVVQRLIETYRTPARWNKAIQHLREAGKLKDSPEDIGPLLIEVREDVRAECLEEIASALFNWAWPQLSRGLTSGLAEHYKDELLKRSFEKEVPSVQQPPIQF